MKLKNQEILFSRWFHWRFRCLKTSDLKQKPVSRPGFHWSVIMRDWFALRDEASSGQSRSTVFHSVSYWISEKCSTGHVFIRTSRIARLLSVDEDEDDDVVSFLQLNVSTLINSKDGFNWETFDMSKMTVCTVKRFSNLFETRLLNFLSPCSYVRSTLHGFCTQTVNVHVSIFLLLLLPFQTVSTFSCVYLLEYTLAEKLQLVGFLLSSSSLSWHREVSCSATIRTN